MIRSSILTICAAGLIGCAAIEADQLRYISAVTPGEKFVLKKPIEIQPGDAHVYLQYGEIMSYNKLNQWVSYCRFEVNKLGKQTIQPMDLPVKRVEPSTTVQGKGVIMYFVEFKFDVSDDSNIRSLTCGNYQDPMGYYITYPEMDKALGSFFEAPKQKSAPK